MSKDRRSMSYTRDGEPMQKADTMYIQVLPRALKIKVPCKT